MSALEEPIKTRTAEFAIDYEKAAELSAKFREMADTIDAMSPAALALTYEHPDWLRQRLNCCGGSGP